MCFLHKQNTYLLKDTLQWRSASPERGWNLPPERKKKPRYILIDLTQRQLYSMTWQIKLDSWIFYLCSERRLSLDFADINERWIYKSPSKCTDQCIYIVFILIRTNQKRGLINVGAITTLSVRQPFLFPTKYVILIWCKSRWRNLIVDTIFLGFRFSLTEKKKKR